MFDDLHEQGIALRSLHEQLDTTTPMGLLMFQMAGMLAEFERGLIAERTKHGMAAAKQLGRKFGPDPKLDAKQVAAIIKALRPRQADRGAVTELARKHRVSTVTLRKEVLKVTKGKRLWPKGPRAK